MRTLLLMLMFIPASAFACRFAKDAQPAQWFEWSSTLLAGDVSSVHTDRAKALDVIAVRVTETFKGPSATVASLQIPSRMWSSCDLARPPAGARVLVALNPNGDTLIVPLTEAYAARLREQRSK